MENYNFETFKNLKEIDLSTKLIGVIIQDIVEREYLDKEKKENKLKESIEKKINEYLKLPITSCELKKEDNTVIGYIEVRNQMPIKFKLEVK